MNTPIDEVALIESALGAIERVLAHAAEQESVPFHGETVLSELPEVERDAVRRTELESYRARPEHCAIHLCLRSATALLDASRQLLRPLAHPSPQQQEQRLNRLVADTKTAGRSAYRAALILMEARTAD